MATGTISGTGATAAVVGRKISIKLDFSGTATVDVEEQMPSGAWIKIVTGQAADYRQIFESPVSTALRLNCTAYTNSVEWALETGIEG